MKKINVLETIRQGSIGGGESHVIDVVKYLDKERFQPFVLSFTEGEMIDQLKRMNVQTWVIPTTTPFDFRVWPTVKKLLGEVRPQIVHAHGTRAMSNSFSSARQLGIPLIYTIHGWSFHDDQNFFTHKFRVMSERFLTGKADVNISVSSSNQESGIRKLKRFQSIVIENGIDLDKFNPDKEYKKVRKELNIPDDNIVIGFIARFTHQKSPLLLVEAFARIVGQFEHVKLLMVGDGELMPDVRKKIAEAGIEEKVLLPGFRKDVPDVLSAIDIYCLPSLWEGLPLGLMEAMAMKKAVIATRVDGSKEIVEHEVNGLLATPGSEKDLFDQMSNLLSNSERIDALGVKACSDIRNRFSVQKMVNRIEDVYQNLAGIRHE